MSTATAGWHPTRRRTESRVAAVDRVGDLGHLLLQVEAVADLLEPQFVVVQLLADERLGVEVLELEVLELRAELAAGCPAWRSPRTPGSCGWSA